MGAKTYVMPVEIEELEDTGGFLAICPAIQGCHAEGESIGEALDELQDVARVLLELIAEDGLPFPTGLKQVAATPLAIRTEIPLTVG